MLHLSRIITKFDSRDIIVSPIRQTSARATKVAMAGNIQERLGKVFKAEVARRDFALLGLIGVGAAYVRYSNADRLFLSATVIQAAPVLEKRAFLPLATKEYPAGISNIKGVAYSPYRDGQNPDWGPYPGEGEVGKHWGIYNSDRTAKHPGLTLK